MSENEGINTDVPVVDATVVDQAAVESAASAVLSRHNRRKFLGLVGGATAASIAGGASAKSAPAPKKPDALRKPLIIDPTATRGVQAFGMRYNAALPMKFVPIPPQPNNGDDDRYPNKIASFSKCLPHNQLGEVDLNAYQALRLACNSGVPAAYDAIPMGGTERFHSPQTAHAFCMEGMDSHYFSMRQVPTFNSAEEAGEIAEVYWMALLRDVPFSQYSTHPLVIAACADLSRMSDFRGPKSNGLVIPDTLFRGTPSGNLKGPYVSQFLYKKFQMGALTVDQRIRVIQPGLDYMTRYEDWLSIQRGGGYPPPIYDQTPRWIRSGRDLDEWVHMDFPALAGIHACKVIWDFGSAALDDNNPYKNSLTQLGFATFGAPDITDLLSRVTSAALKAAWYQKWQVNFRLRPEAFAGRIHNYGVSGANYPIHSDILNSAVLPEVYSRFGSYLLPMAFPEGCPPHPSFPSGHAAFSGASITVLKAFFKEDFIIPNPVMANEDGTALVPYVGEPLTIGGELNKLASNVGMGRDFAGVHWRTDCVEGNKLGEAVAISVLRELKNCYNEQFGGFSLTKFDGTTITV